MNEKEKLIKSFFDIRGNEQNKKLKRCKDELERFLVKNNDSDLTDLLNLVNALITYYENSDKEEARRWVIDIWDKLNSKPNFSLYDIRLLNYILFTEPDIEKLVEYVDYALEQLEIYKFHEDYIRVKVALKLNLLNLLLEAKFFNEQFNDELTAKMFEVIEEVIALNLTHQLNNKYYIGLANMYKGILLKNKNTIYVGFILLESSGHKDDNDLQDLIKMYVQKYNIVV